MDISAKRHQAMLATLVGGLVLAGVISLGIATTAGWLPRAHAQTAVAVPTGLLAHTIPDSASLRVSWEPSDSHTGGYSLQRTDPDGGVLNIPVAAGRTSYTDDATAWATAYSYTVSAVDGTTLTAQSTGSTATTPQGPGAPPNLTASAIPRARDGATAELSWSALPPVVGADDCAPVYQATAINVYRQANGEEQPSRLATLAADATGYRDATVAYGTRYTYLVRADSIIGEGPAATVEISPMSLGESLTGLEVYREGIGFRLWWDQPPPGHSTEEYEIRREVVGHDSYPEEDGRLVATVSADVAHTTMVDRIRVAGSRFEHPVGTKYLYTVTAKNAYGAGKDLTTARHLAVHSIHPLGQQDDDGTAPLDLDVTGKDGISSLAELTWRKPAVDHAQATDDHTVEYRVHRRKMASDQDFVVYDTTDKKKYKDLALEPARYLYKVQGVWLRRTDTPLMGRISRWIDLTIPSAERISDSARPVTATVSNVPATHNGADDFVFRLAFSEDITTRAGQIRRFALEVTGGAAGPVRRVDGRSDLFDILITPDSNGDVTVVINPTTDCSSKGAICSSGLGRMANRLEFAVSGPPRSTGS